MLVMFSPMSWPWDCRLAQSIYHVCQPIRYKTFGYHRAEIIAALINALSLLVIAILIFWEAYKRLFMPEEVRSILC
jgi:Co/Zn/Cd efflux system component